MRFMYFAAIMIIWFPGWMSPANAKELPAPRESLAVAKPKTGWGSAIRGSSPYFTNTTGHGTNTDPGTALNGMVLYTLDPFWNLGIMGEWDQHVVPGSGQEVDKAGTLSILSFFEFHYTAGRLSPYINLGAGINFNTFDDDENVATLCGVIGVGACDFSPEETITARVGVGADFFVSDQLAINIEGAWRRNAGDVSLKIADVTGATRSFTRDTAEALIGFRYYFSPCVQC